MKNLSLIGIASYLVLFASPVMAQDETGMTPFEQQQVEQATGESLSRTQAAEIVYSHEQQQQEQQQNDSGSQSAAVPYNPVENSLREVTPASGVPDTQINTHASPEDFGAQNGSE